MGLHPGSCRRFRPGAGGRRKGDERAPDSRKTANDRSRRAWPRVPCLQNGLAPADHAAVPDSRPEPPPPPIPPPTPFRPRTPVVIGLMGGIAAGKSTVAAAFAAHGLCHVDADQHARAVVEEPAVLAELRAAFGAEIVGAAGRLD